MTARVYPFPASRPRADRLSSSTIELIQVDQALAAVEELAVLAADRLDALPFGSERWSWELERWVSLIAERLDLETRREATVGGGLRLVTGGNGA